MEKFNRDIRPDAAALGDTSFVEPLVENTALTRQFFKFERSAKRFKALYNGLGFTSLLSGYLATVGLIYELTVADALGSPEWLSPVSLGISLVALVTLIWLLSQSYKRKWLNARFLAEYLRCGKFQLYRLLAESGKPEALKRSVEAGTESLLAEVRAMGNSSTAAFFTFQPTTMLQTWPRATAGPVDQSLLAQARESYRLLRRDVQVSHLSARGLERTEELGALKSLGDWTLVGGLVLSAFQLFQQTTGLAETGPVATAVLGGITLWLYVSGAAALVYERGRITRPDRDRYLHYADRIKMVSQGLETADAERFLEIAYQVEQACAEELSEFCRQGESSDFVI